MKSTQVLELIQSRKAPLPKRTEYLWRYFDIHKFINLLQTHVIRFTRMDQFEDPQEGIPLSAFVTFSEKTNLNLAQNLTLSELILDKTLFSKISPQLQKKLNTINAIQKSSFVTCWFAEQKESVAMWNLYSNPDGVALKIPFSKLTAQLKIEKTANISAYYGGRVLYQDFSTVYQRTSDRKVGKVALRKDSSFQHESEFRFVVRTKDHHLNISGINSQKLDLAKLNMKVICHPRMTAWKKKNVESLLKTAGLLDTLQESAIKLRN